MKRFIYFALYLNDRTPKFENHHHIVFELEIISGIHAWALRPNETKWITWNSTYVEQITNKWFSFHGEEALTLRFCFSIEAYHPSNMTVIPSVVFHISVSPTQWRWNCGTEIAMAEVLASHTFCLGFIDKAKCEFNNMWQGTDTRT